MTRSRRPKNSIKSHKHYNSDENSQSPYESNEDDSNSISNSNSPIIDPQSSSNCTKSPNSNPQPHHFPPAIPYVAVAPLPVFHGNSGECPASHLSRFTKVCRANNAFDTDAMARIFPVTLESEAAVWYDLNIEPYPLSWDEIKASFLEAYGKTEAIEEIKSELLALRQKNEEPVRSYFLRMQVILKKWGDHGLKDGVLKGVFVGGLMEDFREWVAQRKPGSLNEAVAMAFGYEKVKRVEGKRLGVEVKCGFCGGAHEEKSCRVKERMRDLFAKMKKKKGVEGEEEEMGRGCQCSKHQCWKKKFERSASLLSRNSAADL